MASKYNFGDYIVIYISILKLSLDIYIISSSLLLSIILLWAPSAIPFPRRGLFSYNKSPTVELLGQKPQELGESVGRYLL